jgi:hypothetical protein
MEYLKYVKTAGENIKKNFNVLELEKPLKRLNEIYENSKIRIYSEIDPFGEENWVEEIDIKEIEKISEYLNYIIMTTEKKM